VHMTTIQIVMSAILFIKTRGVGAVAAVAVLAATLEPSVSFLYINSYITQVHNNPVHLTYDLRLIELNSTSILLILKRIRSQAQDF